MHDISAEVISHHQVKKCKQILFITLLLSEIEGVGVLLKTSCVLL